MTLTFSSVNCDKILKTHFYLSSDIIQVRQQIYHTDKVYSFCREMLCIARLFPSPGVRLSVRLCVRHVRELRQNE